jgi:hypothetical protein
MIGWRVLAILSALGVPAVLAPLVAGLRGRLPAGSWRLLAAIVCLVPLSAPWALAGSRQALVIVLVTILGGIVMLKAIDWFSRPRPENDLVRVWLALTFWPTLEIEEVGIRIPGMRRRITMAARRLGSGVLRVVLGLAMTAAGHWLGVPQRNVWLESSFKAMEIYLLGGGANDMLVAAFALAGYRLTDAFRYPILAHSVLDFWSRYNVWIHRWLKRHVFEPIGLRRRRPVVGILAVFAVSGMLHEYIILPAAPDLLGWQSAFFGLHGLGAIAGAGLGRSYQAITGRRVPRPLAISATFGFVLATTPIFIHCLDRFVDFHRDLGRWVLKMAMEQSPA